MPGPSRAVLQPHRIPAATKEVDASAAGRRYAQPRATHYGTGPPRLVAVALRPRGYVNTGLTASLETPEGADGSATYGLLS